jgi:predicted XRE-type DNA-binding protein
VAEKARPRADRRARDYEVLVEESSGNVFADLGLPDADELMAKAELARTIRALIERQNLTQAAAARLLGTTQPKVSDLFRGRLDGFSMERLYRFLNALGQDVQIVVRPKPRSRDRATIRAQVKPAAA